MRLEDFIGPYQENMNVGIGPVYDSYGLNEPIEMQQPQVGQIGFASQLPSAKEVLGNVAKEAAVNYIGRKVGLSGLGQIIATNTILGNPFATAITPFAPLAGVAAVGKGLSGLQNTTFGRSATIADYLEAKRAEKAAQKVELKELQERVDKGEFGSVTPTPQDKRRGGQYSKGGNGKGGPGNDGYGGQAGTADEGFI